MSVSVPHLPRLVCRLVIGSMSFNTTDWERTSATLDTYIELGGNAIDTAHVYGPEHHKAVGRYLSENGRDKLMLFDKCAHPYGKPRVTQEDILSDLNENQERLGISFTDCFVLHRDNPEVPAGHVVEWMNEHIAAGRIGAFGGSNWTHERIQEGNDYAAKRGLQGFSVSSPNLALAIPNEPMWADALSIANDLAARRWYQESGFPLFSWSAGAHGFFAGLWHDDLRRVYDHPENHARKSRAEEVGAKRGISATQVAIAWVLAQPGTIFATIGPRTPEEAREAMAVLNLQLEADELAYLEHGVVL